MKIYHDQVIEAAYLHTTPRCFYVGPFARRVSFASQQYRAFDLVSAFAEKGMLSPPPSKKSLHVAVIGAGIAGLTIASALRGRDCKVDLYESNAEPLKLQRKAHHRLVHPTISRWPTGPFELTTDFEFLDWFAAPSSEVIEMMLDDWEKRLKPKERDPKFRIFHRVTVTHFLADDESVGLSFDTDRDDVPTDVRYDYIFVAAGFDEEMSLTAAGHESYWTEDEIEKWRATKSAVYVSGCGDGGLIDALRLVHGDFNRGWLTIELAELLQKSWNRATIRTIEMAEAQALMAAKSMACMQFGKPEAEAATGAAAQRVGAKYEEDQIVIRLWNFYRDLHGKLPAAAKRMLTDSLKKAQTLGKRKGGWVTLVSRQPRPFGPYSAPIHKIMVMHAKQSNAIDFRPGELRGDGDERVIAWTGDRPGQMKITDDMGLIVRHGSPANLPGLEDSEKTSLRIRQFLLADYIEVSDRPVAPVPEGYPSKRPRGEELADPVELQRFVEMRQPMASKLIDSLRPGTTVTATPKKFLYSVPIVSPPDRSALRLELPDHIFGIPLELCDVPEASEL